MILAWIVVAVDWEFCACEEKRKKWVLQEMQEMQEMQEEKQVHGDEKNPEVKCEM